MNTFAMRLYGIGTLVVGAALAGTANAAPVAARPDPADPGAAVSPTRYESFLAPQAKAKLQGSPADYWIEANRTVASFDSMSLTMGGSDTGQSAASDDQPSSPKQAPGADPHAGHSMPKRATGSGPMGHAMSDGQTRKAPGPTRPAGPSNPHAGHNMPSREAGRPAPMPADTSPKADPHAGHVMPRPVPDPHAAHGVPEKK